MTALLKDRYKIGLIMATLFFVGIVASIYSIYSLPHDLMLTAGYEAFFTNVYVIIGLTFLVGTLAIWYALQHKNEVIVYREKQHDKANGEQEATDVNKTTISLESVKSSIASSGNEKEILQSGLQAVCKQLDAGQGAVYVNSESNGIRKVELKAGYALSIGESTVISFEYGEGLVGQVAAGAKTIYVDEVPEGYVKILSGLGSASPRYLLLAPVKHNNQVLGVLEIASFTPITEDERKFVEESAELIAGKISGN